MKISRRELFKTASIAAGGLATSAHLRAFSATRASEASGDQTPLPAAFEKLQPLGDRVKPIRAEEFQARVARAQQLMSEAKPRFDALYVTPGTSLEYFTGIRWWPSERHLAFILPRQGNPILIGPGFEEGRLHEQLRWPIAVRVWQEDEDPYALTAKWLSERGMATGRIGVEETTRYAFLDGLRGAARSAEFVSADPVTVGCRAQKSEHELELMRLACSATFDVYRATFASIREGITQREVGDLVTRGYEKMGLSGYAIVLFGPAAALPHGTREDQFLRDGVGVLIDGGTSVEGYQSDITRTGVFGKPTAKLASAFEIVRKAQAAALGAAAAGKECGSVDDAARRVITDAGFGPGYKYFTHRVGHGIGMDGHEWPYLVRGNRTILKAGMTFSDEPGIYVPGDYGLRCEDLMVITDSGAAKLLTPGFAPSLETPIA
ncbi:MAG TPA: Xaa-Pro peptidase family protein [Candidatus Limnocylindria bacterium]|nr:Xaa-Pro peptidase family protein [Candidatus Limnocylindria bacterium]